MKASDLKKLPAVQTATLARATADPETMDYVQRCLAMFFAGMWGQLPAEDAARNNAELASGEGRIVARYSQYAQLQEDIYIIAYFSELHLYDIDFNNITILYVSDY